MNYKLLNKFNDWTSEIIKAGKADELEKILQSEFPEYTNSQPAIPIKERKVNKGTRPKK